jgi:hypothetical protein
VKRLFLKAKQNLNVKKINWQTLRPKFIIPKLGLLASVMAPTLDASHSMGGISKLCRKSAMGISRVGIFPVGKAHDRLLLELHEN